MLIRRFQPRPAKKPKRAVRATRWARLWFEELEQRCLLTGGNTTWAELGPSPQYDQYGLVSSPAQYDAGRVSALAIAGSRMLMGAAGGGVWTSDTFSSATAFWTSRTDNLGLRSDASGLGAGLIDVGSIAVDPNSDGRIIYAGTGEANYSLDSRYGSGILQSVDSGASWALLSSGPQSKDAKAQQLGIPAFFRHSISKIIVDPTDNTGQTLYASVVSAGGGLTTDGTTNGTPNLTLDNGIYKSTDQGQTWNLLTKNVWVQLNVSNKIGTAITVTDMDYSVGPGNNLILYAGVQNSHQTPQVGGAWDTGGVWKSTDGGDSWIQLTAGVSPAPANVWRVSLAADHTPGTSLIYAAVANTNGNLLGVYKIVSDGASVTAVTPPTDPTNGIGWYSLALGLSPNGRLYLGSSSYPGNDSPFYGILESNPGATAWRAIDVGLSGTSPHTDFHAFAFTSDGTVYAGTDGGVWRYKPGPFVNGAADNTYPAGAIPGSVAVGDFNHDGKQDLAVANWADGTVKVLLGNGDGTFGAPTTYATGLTGPINVATGDLNRDGVDDIVVGDDSQQSIVVLWANADRSGGFDSRTTINIGRGIGPVAVGDFTGDGKLDIAAVNWNQNDVTVLPGNGDGTFGAAQFTSTSAQGPVALAAGDFNRDGRTDLAVIGSAGGTVSVLLQQADGTLKEQTFAAGNQPLSGVVAGDLNRDGWSDLLVVAAGGTVYSELSNGDGTFTQEASTVFASLNTVAVGDFNGDGKPDYIAIRSDGSLVLEKGKGDGTFAPTFPVSFGGNLKAGATVRFAGDALDDLVVTDSGAGVVRSLIGTQDVPAPAYGTWENLNTPTQLRTLQLNGVAMHPASPSLLLEGSQDNGTALTTDGGVNWNAVAGSDGGLVRYDSLHPNIAWKWTAGDGGVLGRSMDGGRTWMDTSMSLGVGSGSVVYAPFDISAASPKRVMVGAFGTVYESSNATNIDPDPPPTFTPKTTIHAGASVTAVAYSAFDSDSSWVGFSDGTVFRTSDDWQTKTQLFMPAGIGPVTGIAIDPSDSTVGYVTVGGFADGGHGHVFRPVVNVLGEIGGNLPNVPANAIVLTRGNNVVTLYVATDVGVYTSSSANGIANYSRYGTGLPFVQVTDLGLKTYGNTTYLAAATYGRGAWRVDPPTPGAPDVAQAPPPLPRGLGDAPEQRSGGPGNDNDPPSQNSEKIAGQRAAPSNDRQAPAPRAVDSLFAGDLVRGLPAGAVSFAPAVWAGTTSPRFTEDNLTGFADAPSDSAGGDVAFVTGQTSADAATTPFDDVFAPADHEQGS